MNLNQYLESVSKRYLSGISREHSYRADLEALIRELVTNVEITNEPANVTDCGNPDYVITKGNIPIGFIEAKDIGKDLNSKTYKSQFDRYRKALDNLIITDYIWFQFFQDGSLVHEVRIADIVDGKIVANSANFEEFIGLVQSFCTYIGNTIKSPKKLAGMMAAKARLLQVILEKAISSDEQSHDNTALKQQFLTFKDILIHDLDPSGFADIYSQTLAYGMFAARLHDDTLETFSRQEAAELIPKSNPFLRKLFSHVAGNDIDERIKTTVDNLADVFRATDVKALLKNFGKTTQTNDPIIHFYETFLAEYDPKLRKARGVWYTPEPVVNFIVRGVDEILKTEFGLKDGLADTSKTTIDVEVQGAAVSKGKNKGKAITQKKEVHKVQVLDPATGTGTFLAEVVKFIYNGKFKAMQGAWSSYVDEHLIPRLNGFELLMASYAMAHLKLDMLLRDTGFEATKEQRLNIYLTNSLEEHHADTGTLFSSWLSTEANEANHIKRDTPVMVVMGNPPYSVSSSNKSDWIQELIKDYKKDLNEKNIQPLSDDYIKFIRYGQHFIDKNGEGILAYISNNSFIDGVIHRQMRKSLLESFDKIYILDLHGNSNRQETSPDGSADENVFDIQQGVSINIFVKSKKNSKGLAEVFHKDVFGKRSGKYDKLNANSLSSLSWAKLSNQAPEYFFVAKDFKAQASYKKHLSLKELFLKSNVGINTEFDQLAIQDTNSNAVDLLEDLRHSTADEMLLKYEIDNKKVKKVNQAISDIKSNSPRVVEIVYRPFDSRFSIYTGASNGLMGRPRNEINKHMLHDNLGLISMRQYAYNVPDYCYSFISKSIITSRVFISNKGYCSMLPLYLYPEEDKQQNLGEIGERKPNLDTEIVDAIAKGLGLVFEAEKSGGMDKFAPIDVLDYIYAVLHSPTYRETYKEFLKIDFPRIPYPKDTGKFWALVKLGGELRQIHLLESSAVENYITSYPKDGDNVVTRKLTKTSLGYEAMVEETTPTANAPTPSNMKGNKDSPLVRGVAQSDGVSSNQTGRVWINDDQYFDQVPLIAWEFYIGGYQPAQKWLKDRTGRKLSFDDILHYQKIIVALTETHRIMQEIDVIEVV